MGSSAWQVVLWRLAEVTDMMSWRCGSVCGSCGSCYSSVTRRSYCNLFDGLLFTYIYIYIIHTHFEVHCSGDTHCSLPGSHYSLPILDFLKFSSFEATTWNGRDGRHFPRYVHLPWKF